MGRIELGAHWLSFHESGEGDPVLLLHSGGFSSRQWRKLADLLAPAHRVVSPDLLGYGASSPWPFPEPFHFHRDREALEALLAQLARPAHVVGHSYGGLLALQLALSCPSRVRSLTLYEPVAFGILDEPSDQDALSSLAEVDLGYDASSEDAAERWLMQFVDWWNGAGAWNGLAAETQNGLRRTVWKLSQEVASLVTDTTRRADYARILVPTLLLGGDRSPAAERRVVEKLAVALAKARVQLFPGVGHMGPISHAPLLNPVIEQHIRASSMGT